MKNIWRIFSGDMKRLVRNPFALVIAIGLCIIPSLYAWFNIYSNWDPYANTKNIKIAVATEDTGYQMDDGTTVNMGDSVIESLKENDKIGWVFTDTKDICNVRAKASADAELLGKVDIGVKLKKLGTSGDWTKVKFQGKTGYIKSNLLKKVK